MNDQRSYRIAFFTAVALHLTVLLLLVLEPTHKQPVLALAQQNENPSSQPAMQESKPIQAVSVEQQEVMKTINRLKQERLHQKQAEENRQKMLLQQAENLRKQRVAEQQHLEKIKEEAKSLALARERQAVEEQKKLAALAKQTQEQEKHLADMKNQQQEEAHKLAELEKKKAQELLHAQKEKEMRKQADLEQKKQEARQQAQFEAAQNARIAGEVDKYKALILQAIGQQWILPDNADRSQSCQFSIRLAPNGLVLEVSLIQSSGDPVLDRSAQSAIYKASPLPVPSDPKTFDLFRTISLRVRPENARG